MVEFVSIDPSTIAHTRTDVGYGYGTTASWWYMVLHWRIAVSITCYTRVVVQ